MNSISLLAFVAALFVAALAFTIIWSERRSLVHLVFFIGMMVLAIESIFFGLSLETDTVEKMFQWQCWRMVAMSFLPGIWLFFALSYGRGNYREFLSRWQIALGAIFLLPIGTALLFRNQVITSITRSPNGNWTLALGMPGFILTFIFLLSAVLILMNLERTFRASVGTLRWRIKFMILGIGVLFAVRAYTVSQELLFHALDVRLQALDCGALIVACVLILRSLFRAGHFDMDVYPSHSIIQSSLTIFLAGVYLLIIGVFAKVVSHFGGDKAFTLKAFLVLAALVLLTIFLLSNRVRSHTSRFVSRHFQRPKYEYRSIWQKFTNATASSANQIDFCQASVKSIADIFQALSVSIWIMDDRKEELIFGASTFLSAKKAKNITPQNTDVVALMQALREKREPFDISSSKENWAQALRISHPSEFKDGNCIGAAITIGSEILGVLILSDRVSGENFSGQEYDLLKCISDQMAAGLLNLRLAKKLLQAKELEAFQTMSAFFVHDLKNTANTLNLMLQNLPIHFDDPAFRADALRSVSKTVAHINTLIGRLGSIRQELQIKPLESDLNELIIKALTDWEEISGVNLTKDFSPLPKFYFDPEQILKVATNLIFNAREAVSQSGQVRIQTSQSNGWAIFTVADNGCGMSADFLSRSLFRPFQTTKKNGLGIGMFQSKMIVEAHKGRLEVESEPDKGTTFRVYLPLKPEV
jgi:putative PEP-CTERM system histidine kinase